MGATGGTRAPVPATPNYVAKLEHKVSWARFPLTVMFVRDAENTADLEREALSGFRQWESATDGLVRFEVIEASPRADITVRFNPASNDGATTNSFTKSEMVRAEMQIGVKRGRGSDIACIAAHELGHALGITGHSDDRKDLMYPYQWAGKGCGISRRDLNTLSARYPALASRLESASATANNSR